MKFPETVRAGIDPIRAEDHNSVVRFLMKALRIYPTNGIGARWTEDGLSIYLANRSKEWILPGRILARTGSDPDFAANITYTAGALGRYQRNADGSFGGLVLRNATPKAGRPVKGPDAALVKIRPAEVGGMCWIVLDKVNGTEGNPASDVGRLVLFEGGDWGETCVMAPCTGGAP